MLVSAADRLRSYEILAPIGASVAPADGSEGNVQLMGKKAEINPPRSDRKFSRRALSESLNGAAKQTAILLDLIPDGEKKSGGQEGVDPPGG